MGDAYFVDANYEAAVEAYTESLATKADATTYQRRAAAYLALKKNLKVSFSLISYELSIHYTRCFYVSVMWITT